MRIASLVPSATEMLFALGLGDQVVAVTHECDWPPAATSVPHLTRTVVPDGLSAAGIDRVVRETVGAGRPLYELEAGRLAELDPELIVTQAVCDVCAVSHDDVVAVAATLPSKPQVISLDPLTLEDVLDDVRRLGDATNAAAESRLLREQARRRIEAVEHAIAGESRPRVAAIEWLDPPFIAGHWVPEMIRLAGGEDALGTSGGRSRTAGWGEIAASEPDVVVAMPCGYDAQRSAREAELFEQQLAGVRAGRIVAVDASAYFSRPGPRLIMGIELLSHLLHPDRVPAPPGAEHVEVVLAGAGGGT